MVRNRAIPRAKLGSLFEMYFLEELTDGSEANEDEDENFANYIPDEDDNFDFRQSCYDTTIEVADRSIEGRILWMRNYEKLMHSGTECICQCCCNNDLSIS